MTKSKQAKSDHTTEVTRATASLNSLVSQLTPQRVIVPLLLIAGIGAALAREVLFALYYGNSFEIEVFRLAYSMPNLLSQTVASAFLGAAIPLLIKRENQGAQKYDLFVSRLLFVNWTGALLIAGLGIVFAGAQTKLLAPGYTEEQLAYMADQLRIVWVFFLFVSMSFAIRAVLNSRDILWPGPSTSLLISLCFVIACATYAKLSQTPVWSASKLSLIAVAAAVLALLMHLAQQKDVLATAYRHLGRQLFSDLGEIRALGAALSAVVIYKVFEAVPRFIDRAIASGMEAGSVAALDYSYGIINVPGVLFATSVITIAYPRFARAADSLRNWRSISRYSQLFVLGLFCAIVTGIFIATHSTQIIELVYKRGAFGTEATQQTATLLTWHGYGLGAMVGSMIITQALLAYQAFSVVVAIFALRIVVKLIAIKVLVPEFALAGLGMTFSVAEIFAFICSSIAFVVFTRRRIRAASAI